MEQSELNLIRMSRKGDNRAFEKLVRKYEQKIYNLILGMTGNKTEASDLFQEAFLSTWRNIQGFKGESSFSTWLYRIAVNAVLMKRRKKRLQTVPLDETIKTSENEIKREFPGDWSENPLATMQNDELRDRLSQAISLLPEKYRTVLVLSDLQGMPNEEITRIMNLSLPSVKSRLHRARLFLRNRLSDYFRRP